MEKNKVKLNIAGSSLCILTDENVEDTLRLADDLDDRITTVLNLNPRLSTTQAAIYVALEYADAKKQSDNDARNLRSQVQEYLELSAKARTDAEVCKREVERLKKEVETLRNK